VCDQVLNAGSGLGIGHDMGDRYLARDGIGPTDHRGLEDALGLVEGRLDLLGIEVLATADDQVLDPVDQRQVTVLVEPSDVPVRSQPSTTVSAVSAGRLR